VCDRHHRFGSVSWRQGEGRLEHVEENNREIRVADDDAAEPTDESRSPETSVVLTARLLANPRRVRRN
jgi:hypothetical protein